MSVTVIIEFEAKPEATNQMKEMLKELQDTRAFDGCQHIDVYNNVDKDGDMVLVEKWDSRKHKEKYLAWRTETGILDKLMEMIVGEPSIRYFEKLDL